MADSKIDRDDPSGAKDPCPNCGGTKVCCPLCNREEWEAIGADWAALEARMSGHGTVSLMGQAMFDLPKIRQITLDTGGDPFQWVKDECYEMAKDLYARAREELKDELTGK